MTDLSVLSPSPHPPPSSHETVTFLFTDIEGSTALWESYPDQMRLALARHDALLERAVADGDGSIVKTTGDGVVAAFRAAPDALNAALAAQQALHAETWPPPVTVRVRMALHTGAAEYRGGDYFGQELNRAARLMAAGHGGQVLLSDATQELCRSFLPSDAFLQSLGEHRLKDLSRPETVYQLRHPALGDTFPPLRTLDNPALPNNLPQQLTSFIGRESEVREVKNLLARTRLLTLSGTGGAGKTRLSQQVAADILDEYPDGVWLVELASLTDPALVPQAVAQTLSVREQAGRSSQESLIEQSKSRRFLLLLDNCEHLVASCASLTAALLRSCPEVCVLATSREPLGIAGEQVYRVPSLSLPDPRQGGTVTSQSLNQYEAVRLFTERTLLVKSDFAVTDNNAPALAQLCCRLDGIPLAIELAAARVRALSVEDINNRLDSRFRLLTGGDRSALPRQQTLRALVDWSYDLLGEQEKILFARLSVFAGGWTLSAAEAVCGTGSVEEWEVLDLLTGLVDKSLVLAELTGGSGTTRYRMLETLRQYGAEKGQAASDSDTVRNRHRDWFVAFAEEAAVKGRGSDQATWLTRLETEHDNLRAALDWCIVDTEVDEGDSGAKGLRLSGSLWRFWWMRGYYTEGRERLGRALEQARTHRPTAAKAMALHGAGNLAQNQGDFAAARSLYEQGIAISRVLGDRRGVAVSLGTLGHLANELGDHATARSLQEEAFALFRELGDRRNTAYSLTNLGCAVSDQGDTAAAELLHEESLALFRELGNSQGITMALTNLGNIAVNRGDYERARTLLEESLAISRELGDKRGTAVTLINLGGMILKAGEHAAARPLQEESLAVFEEMGDKAGIAYCLEGLAATFLGESEARQSVLLWGATEALRDSLGSPTPPDPQGERERRLDQARSALGAEAFADAWEAGRALDWKHAVAVALGRTP